MFVATKSSVTVHYFKNNVGEKKLRLPILVERTYDFETLTSAFNTIGQISSFIGVLLVVWFAKIVAKRKPSSAFRHRCIQHGIYYFLSNRTKSV
jgi:hypothetical protein